MVHNENLHAAPHGTTPDPAAPCGTEQKTAALTIRDGILLRDGEPHRILAGAIHYFRVHPDQWEDRIARLVAMGANTLDTYVAWNFHQLRREDRPDFTGWKDLVRFITLAGDAGLDVIVRPGPYICAEWDNGGLPAWLTGTTGIGLRSSDAVFTAAVGQWFDELLPQLVPLQAANGGPIVAVQIENEYGSYGDDKQYLRWNKAVLREGGITEVLFTADGGTDYFLDGGALPDTWATATLGSRGDEAIAVWEPRRPGEPFFNVEFWNGWFDHWGETHHTRSAGEAAGEARKMLGRGGSICLYMAHGGTNFGLGAGANHDGSVGGAGLQPTITSYDSDAPIAEDGRLTEKFHAMRAEFHAASGQDMLPVPEVLSRAPITLASRVLPVQAGVPLLDFVRSGPAVSSVSPLSFEQLGLDRGMVHYSATAVLPAAETAVKILGLHDRAYVWIDGGYVGVLDSSTAEEGVKVTGVGKAAQVEILVENQGRINYGPLFGQGKGILGGVLIGQRYIFHWEQRTMPLEDLDEPALESLAAAEQDGSGMEQEQRQPAGASSGFHRAELELGGGGHDDGGLDGGCNGPAADAHLALPGFVKGFVWINGFLLGRYWETGPQVTLYIPGPLLRSGKNRITVLELERPGSTLELRDRPELGAGEQHVQELP